MSAPRDERGRLLPGAVLNPKGRPKNKRTIAQALRRIVDPDELATFAVEVARNKQLPLSDRWRALVFITEHCDGKAPQRVKLDTGIDPTELPDMGELSEAQLEALITLKLTTGEDAGTVEDDEPDDETGARHFPDAIDV